MIAALQQGPSAGTLEAHQALERFARDRGPAALDLLMHLAVPQTLRAELVHLVKLNFLPALAADLAVEADALFAPVIQDLGDGFFRIDPEARTQLLDHLAGTFPGEAPTRIHRVARFLLAWVEHPQTVAFRADAAWRDFLEVERWVAYAFLDPQAAAETFAQALADASGGSDTAAVARLQLGGLAEALSLPLPHQRDLLTYAAGVSAAEAGDDAVADRLLRQLGDRDVAVGGVTLSFAELSASKEPSTPAQSGPKTHVEPTSRIFLSPWPHTSRFTKRIGSDLDRRGFEVWDRAGPPRVTRADLMTDGIRQADRVVVVVDTDDLDTVATQVEAARASCKEIVFLADERIDLSSPSEMFLSESTPHDHVVRFTDAERSAIERGATAGTAMLDTVAYLRAPVPRLAIPFGVPTSLPDYELDATLADHVATVLGDAGSRIVVLTGSPAEGRSLAQFLALECDTRRLFPDGILWYRVDHGPRTDAAVSRFDASVDRGAITATAGGARQALVVIDRLTNWKPLLPILEGMGPHSRLLLVRPDLEQRTSIGDRPIVWIEVPGRRGAPPEPDVTIDIEVARRLIKANRFEEAAEAFREIIDEAPRNEEARLGLGHLLRSAGDLDTAEQVFRDAVDHLPESAALRRGLAQTLHDGERASEAEQVLHEAIEVAPDEVETHTLLGQMLLEQERYAEAEERFRAALGVDPDHGEAQDGLEDVLARQQEAHELEEAAATEPPSDEDDEDDEDDEIEPQPFAIEAALESLADAANTFPDQIFEEAMHVADLLAGSEDALRIAGRQVALGMSWSELLDALRTNLAEEKAPLDPELPKVQAAIDVMLGQSEGHRVLTVLGVFGADEWFSADDVAAIVGNDVQLSREEIAGLLQSGADRGLLKQADETSVGRPVYRLRSGVQKVFRARLGSDRRIPLDRLIRHADRRGETTTAEARRQELIALLSELDVEAAWEVRDAVVRHAVLERHGVYDLSTISGRQLFVVFEHAEKEAHYASDALSELGFTVEVRSWREDREKGDRPLRWYIPGNTIHHGPDIAAIAREMALTLAQHEPPVDATPVMETLGDESSHWTVSGDDLSVYLVRPHKPPP